MDRKLRNRIVLYLLLAVVLAFVLIKLSGRKPAPKISAVTPVRENLTSSISSNGKVEPISPYVMRAELNTFVEKVHPSEGQQVKRGQLLLELDVKDAAAQLAETRSKLLQAQDDLRAARAGGRADAAAKAAGSAMAPGNSARGRCLRGRPRPAAPRRLPYASQRTCLLARRGRVPPPEPRQSRKNGPSPSSNPCGSPSMMRHRARI